MNESQPVSRRLFLGASAAAVTAASLPAKSYARVIGANDRIRIGFIGAGHIAQEHFQACKKIKDKDNLEFLGVCDCWEARAAKGASLMETDSSVDYRHLLDNKNIDYVVISTPEHQHAQMTLDALDAGKSVYCEKPLTHTIDEALAVAKKQAETGKAVQVGVQGLSNDSYRSAAKAIADGVIGQVLQAQIEYARWYQKTGPWRVPDVVAQHAEKPADLDWNAWLGHAPKVDWDPHHYFEWRNYSSYSGGIATDLFVHRISRIIQACNLGFPRRVVGMGGIWQWDDGRNLPDNFEMICEYPRGMTVYVLGTMSNRVGIDHLIRGYRATMYFTGSGWEVRDKDGKVLRTHKKTGAEDNQLHHINLHDHLRNGTPLNCPVELGLAGVVAVNMANESWRTSQVMGWDAKEQKMVPAHTLNLSHLPEKT